MSKEIVFNVSQTATLQNDSVKTYSTIEAALTEMVNKYNSPDYTAVINLNNAAETITKRWEGMRFNIHLIGNSVGNTKPKIYFDKGISDLKSSRYSYDDSIFAFEGTYEKRIEVKINNVEFMPFGITPDKQSASNLIKYSANPNDTSNNGYHHTYLIKIYWGKAVELDNVISTLKNGAATNLDMRICDNVKITNCTFTNYNALDIHKKDNRTGCIIQLRGDTNGVTITNNKFYKYGNDEIIGLFGNNYFYDGYTGFIPDDLKRIVVRKNIFIASNQFVYHKPASEQSSGNNEQTENHFWDTADVLITFSSDQQNSYWDNLLFAHNTFDISYLVSQVVKVAGFNYAADLHNFRIIGNKITHYYTSSHQNAQIQDFRLVSYKGETVGETIEFPSVEIARNNVIANEKLGETWGGHCNLYMSGAAAWVHDNIFNGIGFRVETVKPGQTEGITPIAVRGLSCALTFENNVVTGMAHVASIEMKDLVKSQYVDMNIRGNRFDGYTTIYFTESMSTTQGAGKDANTPPCCTGRWRITDNLYNTKSYFLITNGFPKHGSLCVKDNTYNRGDGTAVTKSGVELSYNIPHTLDKFVFTGNALTGDIYMTSVNPPAAKVVVVNDNFLGEK